MAKTKVVKVATNKGPLPLESLGGPSPLGQALISLRKGNAIEGKVLEKSFTIRTKDLGDLKVPTNQLMSIILKNKPNFPLDVLRLLAGNEISGVVLTNPVWVKSDQVGKISIPLAKILAIQF